MARLPRLLLAGLPHHLGQRGHNGQVIVADNVDRQHWYELLRDAAVTHQVAVHAWALLDTAFHLVATPVRAEGLSGMMQALSRRHAVTFNRRHGRRGTLWEGRFRASLIEPGAPLLQLMLFAETLFPGLGGELDTPDSRPALVSSLGHHLGRWRDPVITEPGVWWGLGNTPFEREAAWQRQVDHGVAPELVRRLQAALHRGRPVGSPVFLDRLASESPWSVVPRPRGRPAKTPPVGTRLGLP